MGLGAYQKAKPLYKAILGKVRTADLYKAKQALAAAGVKRTSVGNLSTKKALEAVDAVTPFLKSDEGLRMKTAKHRLGAIVESEGGDAKKKEALEAAKTKKEEKLNERRERVKDNNANEQHFQALKRNLNVAKSERGKEAVEEILNDKNNGAEKGGNGALPGAAPAPEIGKAGEAIDVPD